MARESVGRKPVVTKRVDSKPAAPKPMTAKVVAAKSHANNGAATKSESPAMTKRQAKISAQVKAARGRLEQSRDLAARSSSKQPANGQRKDRLIVMVRDAYWLHAHWELTRLSVERAQAALGQDWHSAKPVLRLLEISNSAESVSRDIEIHGGVNNWYIDVQDPPKSYRLEIGYLAASGKFYALTRSNIVTTPKPGSGDEIDRNWTEVAQDYERIYAQSGGYDAEGSSGELQELFEERLRRPMGSPVLSRYAPGVEAFLPKKHKFSFEVDAELIVYGKSDPEAYVTLQGAPVRLRPDGSFTVRCELPNCRQVIPAVARSRDGIEQRTVVLAIERNTKVMEPLIRDGVEQ